MKKQQGFAALETILILVVVAAIGFTGWYAMNAQNKATDASQKLAKTNSTQSNKATKLNATYKSDPSTNNGYLTVKQWNVRIKLSQADRTAYYSTEPFEGMPPGSLFTIYSAQTDHLKGSAGGSCKGEYVAYLVRLPNTSSVLKDPSALIPNGEKKIGNYTFVLQTKKGTQPTCFNAKGSDAYNVLTDVSVANSFNRVVTALVNDFPSIQPAK